MAFPRLFTPMSIGAVDLRNRIVVPSHGTGYGDDRDLVYLDARARGGAAFFGINAGAGVNTIAFGPSSVSPGYDWDETPPSPLTQAGARHYDDEVIPRLRTRAEVVHRRGAKCFGQVYHLGAAPSTDRATAAIAPSAVADPYIALVPHQLTEEEIEGLVFAFAQGVRRIREAGLDAAEIHGAHGYLVSQFLSPYFNRRTDGWGGDEARRMRFLESILAKSREVVGADFPIGVRLGVDGDGETRGISVAELATVARRLSGQVSWVSVSGGNSAGFGTGHELAYVSPWYEHAAFNLAAARAVKSSVDAPVILTGRIIDPAVGEAIIRDGDADLVGMVRALIADPELPNKARVGDTLAIRTCLGMSECHYLGRHRTKMTCAVNAAAARERELKVVPAARPKTVVVVGAGPAGMEAARVARLRGHDVYLCDAARQIGGTIRLLARDPGRRNLLDHAVFFEEALNRLGVTLMLGNRVTADELVDFRPDVVVVATGGRPIWPAVPGLDTGHGVTALDVIADPGGVGDHVVVVGGLESHLAPPTVADFLARTGRRVDLLTEHVDFAPGVEDGTRIALLERLSAGGVNIHYGHRLSAVTRDGVLVIDTFAREERSIPGVSVVVAAGLEPNDHLALELRGSGIDVRVIGDALAPRRMMHATLDGARVAVEI